MSVVARLRRKSLPVRSQVWGGPSWPAWLAPFAGRGVGTVEQTLRNAASWACIDVLADAIGRTPFDAVRYVGGARQPVVPVPALLDRPSGIVQPDVWRFQLAWSLLTDGNAFGQVVAERNSFPTQVEWLDPVDVSHRRLVGGVPTVTVAGTDLECWPYGPVWHVPGRMIPPGSPFAFSPVRYAARTVGTSLAAEDFGARFFEDGGHPAHVLKADQELSADQAQAAKDAYQRATKGTREPAVLGSGWSLEALQSDLDSTQFIDLLRFEVEQACRFWRVPPAMVYAASSGQNVTYANVTQADLHYLKHSLDGYLVRIENAMTAAVPRPQIVRANRNAILRADVKARMETYEIKLRNQLATVNEVRALEDEPPFEGDEFDRPGVPGSPDLMDGNEDDDGSD